MTGLAEAAALRGEWDEVIAWGTRAIGASPQNPEALKLLAEAYTAIGDRENAGRQHRRFKELAHSFPRIYDRHWALFCADNDRDLDEAYTLAKKDLNRRTRPGRIRHPRLGGVQERTPARSRGGHTLGPRAEVANRLSLPPRGIDRTGRG